MNDAVRIALVHLTSDAYSVPKGTMGYVVDRCEHMPGFVSTMWVDNPGPGGGSVPVAEDDLEPVAMLSVKVPERVEPRRLNLAELGEMLKEAEAVMKQAALGAVNREQLLYRSGQLEGARSIIEAVSRRASGELERAPGRLP